MRPTCLSIVISALATSVVAAEPPVAAPAATSPAPQLVTLKYAGKPVAEYVATESPYKPYVRQLFTPGGVNVVRDQVLDHIHHHGLMFAWRVDGVNCWEEQKNPGSQLDRGHALIGENGLTQDLAWAGPDRRATLMTERRRLTVNDSPDPAASLLTWQATFAAPAGVDAVEIAGNHYYGLGMRFLKVMDGAGPFIDSDGKERETVRNDEKLVRAKWCAYIAAVDGKPVTVALFDAPGNFRPAVFFTMSKPFAYLSATLAVHRHPFKIEQGKPLTLVYGVAAWDGAVDAERIGKLYEAWKQQLP